VDYAKPSMPHGFDSFRVFVSAPGDLERDRETCYEAIAETNESTAMPAKVLLVSVGLRDNEQITGSRSITSDNVRWSTFFIQIFQDDWGPRDLFRKLFLLAMECRDDAAMPMRDVMVCLKDAPQETNPEILAFRKELENHQELRILRYSGVDELRTQLKDVCDGWARELIDSKIGSATGGGLG
jgi:hypothetical protein